MNNIKNNWKVSSSEKNYFLMDFFGFDSEAEDDFKALPVINSHAGMEQRVHRDLHNHRPSRLTLADYIQQKRKEKEILRRFEIAREQIEASDPNLLEDLLKLKEEHEHQEAIAGRIKYHRNVLRSVIEEDTEDEDVEEVELPPDPPKKRSLRPRLNMVWQQRLEASRREKARREEEERKAEEMKKSGITKKRREKKEKPRTPAVSAQPKLHETLRDRAFEAILNRLFRRQWVSMTVSPVPGERRSSEDSNLTSTQVRCETLTPPSLRRTSNPEAETRHVQSSKTMTPLAKYKAEVNNIHASDQASGGSSLSSRRTNTTVTTSRLSNGRTRKLELRTNKAFELRSTQTEAVRGIRTPCAKRLFGGCAVRRVSMPIVARGQSRSTSHLCHQDRLPRHPISKRSWSFQSLNLTLPDSGGSRKSRASTQPRRPDTGYISLNNPQPDLVTSQDQRGAKTRPERDSLPPDVVPKTQSKSESRDSILAQPLPEETTLPFQPTEGCKSRTSQRNERPLTTGTDKVV